MATKLKVVKYKTGKDFGVTGVEEIRPAILVHEGSPSLLYHPRSKDGEECGSFDFCEVYEIGATEKDVVYTAAKPSSKFINIESQKDLDKIAKVIGSIKYKDIAVTTEIVIEGV